MNKMAKVMIAFGLVWLFVWCLVGFIMGAGQAVYRDKMAELAKQGGLIEFWRTFSTHKSHSLAHSHALCNGFLLILVGLAMPYIAFSDKTKQVIGLLLIIGVVIFGIFDWFFFMPLLIVASILIIVTVLLSSIGALRGISK